MAGMKDSDALKDVLSGRSSKKKRSRQEALASLEKRNKIKLQAMEEESRGGKIDTDIRQPVDLRKLSYDPAEGKDDWFLHRSRQRNAQFAKPAVIEKGEIDPLGTGATLLPEPLLIDGPRLLAIKSKKKLDRILTMDTETWSLRPDQLHFGYILNPKTKEKFLFRHWHAPVIEERTYFERASEKAGKKKGDLRSVSHHIDYNNPGFFEWVNLDIVSRPKDEGFFQRIYAHNLEGFEGPGIAASAQSNRDYEFGLEKDQRVFSGEAVSKFTWMKDGRVLNNKGEVKFTWKEDGRVFNNKGEHRFTWIVGGQVIDHKSNSQLTWEDDGQVFDHGGRDRFSWHKKLNRHPDVEPYLRKGMWEDSDKNCTPLLMKTPIFDPDTGHILRYEDVSWSIQSSGNKHYIRVKWGKNVTEIVDSMWHLPGKLKNYGAKGRTPMKYTNPVKWLKREIRKGRLVLPEDASPEEIDQMLYDYWFNDLTEEDKEYCLNDCIVLGEALERYREIYGDYFQDPVSGEAVDPLECLTLAAAALAGMIISSPRSLRTPELNDKGYVKAMIGYDAGHNGGKPQFHLLDTPDKQAHFFAEFGHILQKQSCGYVNKDFPALIDRPMYLDAGIAAMFKHVQTGGRTEVFQPRNAPNTRIEVLDINNSYGSAMFGINNGEHLRVAEPTEIQQLKENYHGREAILKRLDSHSGMYLIRSKPPKLQSLRKRYPIFSLRMQGTEYDERLCFPDWEGRLYLFVTGEELRYMLQLSEIEDDDIIVLKAGSYDGPLVDMTEMPFASFIQMVYADRKRDNIEVNKILNQIEAMEAEGKDTSDLRARAVRLETERQIRKNLMNTSYGKMVENHKSTEIMEAIPSMAHRNKTVLEKMRSMTPEWENWYEMDQFSDEDFGTEKALGLASRWGNDHYLPIYNRNIIEKGIKRIKISLPGELAQYAIRSLGTAITAFGRIFLHRGLMAVDRVLLDSSDTKYNIRGFVVLYVDTDSMHIQVPVDMTREQVAAKLSEPTFLIDGKERPIIQIGDGLGQWKIENVKITDWLISDEVKEIFERDGIGPHDVDGFYVAPKHYYLTSKPDRDGYRHVLQEVAKGVSTSHTAMRVAMYGFSVSSSRLGDPNGLRVEQPTKVDLLNNLKKAKSHRRSYEVADEVSSTVQIKAPMRSELIGAGGMKSDEGGVEGLKIAYIDYMMAVQSKTFEHVSDVGLQETLDEYMETCKARNVTVTDLHNRIRKAHKMLALETDKEVESSKMLHYNHVMEWVESSFIAKPFKVKDGGKLAVIEEGNESPQSATPAISDKESPDAKETEKGPEKPRGGSVSGGLEGADLWDDMFDESED